MAISWQFRHWLQKLFSPRRRPIQRRQRTRLALECLEDRTMPSVTVNLVVPPSSPSGVTNALTVQYTNNGTSPAAAPVLVLSADNANLWLPNDPAVSGSSLQVLATNPNGPAGTLAPGASGSIVVDYAPTNTADNVNFSVGQLTPEQPINWAPIQANMRPSTIPAAAWSAVFANFTANFGSSTTTSYQATLDGDATYLAQLGEPTNDVARLITYEINKADDAFSTTALGNTVDASLPTPGSLSLSFQRWYQPGVAARYESGTLGLGWTNNWDITASADSNGNVTIDEAGSMRYFTKQSDGSYLGSLGDDGVLTALSAGGYKLTEADGNLTVFNAGVNGISTLNYVQDSNGNQIFATYNASGSLTQLTAANNGQPIGEYLTFSYTNGLLTSVSDSTGETTTYAYDPTGQFLLSATNAFGTTSYSYITGQGAAAQNALASITSANGSHACYSYDSEGRLTDEHQDNGQNDVHFAFLAAGGYTATDALGNKTTVFTDDSGEVCETIDALGNITRYSYDASGDLLQVQGPQGANYSYTYDSNGNMLSEIDPLGYTTTFTYNASNDLTSYTDPKGNETTYAYNSGNNLLSIAYADGTQEAWSNYNPQGEASQYVDANDKAVTSQYNSQGQITQQKFADGSSYAYTYDAHGNMLTATSSAGTIQFEYQNQTNPDLLTEVLYPNGQFLMFSYNAAGQRTQSVDQTGFVTNYVYDALGRLSELTDGSGKLIVKYTYDAAGNLIQKDNANGTRTAYTYDADGNVLSIYNLAAGHVTVNSFDVYTYDGLGNVLTDSNQDGQWAYTYDADSQLTLAVFTPNGSNPDQLPSQKLQYAYDMDGNRTMTILNGVTTTYVVNNRNEYVSSTTNGVTTTYQYDNDGNLISQTTAGVTTSYSYSQLGQLLGVSGPGLSASYTYDPLGNRNSQTVNGVTTQFLNDPLTGVASSYTGSGSLIAHYTTGLGLVSQVSAAGTAGYYDFNLTGNTVGITGASGSYVNKYSYLPFGQTTTITAALANSFTFVGEFGVMQDSSSLFNMQAREYLPMTGQFLSNDPTGLNGGDTNIRRYTGNDPVALVDPTGLQWITNEQARAAAYKNLQNPQYQAMKGQQATVNIMGPTDNNPTRYENLGNSGPYQIPAQSGTSTTKVTNNGNGPTTSNTGNKNNTGSASFPNRANNAGGASTTQKDLYSQIKYVDYGNSGPVQLQWVPPQKMLTPLPSTPAPDPELPVTPDFLEPVDGITQLVDGFSTPDQTDTTIITQNPVPVGNVIQGTTDTVLVGGYTASGGGPYTPEQWLVRTVWQDGVVTTDTVVPDPWTGTGPDPDNSFSFYATRYFPTAGQFTYTGGTITYLPNGWTGDLSPGYVNVLPALAPVISGGDPVHTERVSASLFQATKIDPPLVVIDTTDPSITSASQVSVSVGAPANSDTPVPQITGVTVTPLGGGVTQVVIDGVVSTTQPSAGQVYDAPLTITLGNEAPLTVQGVVWETDSNYTVNPANVVAVAGQPLQNVEVATVAGPANGNYSATINWGDGETSTGNIVALGGGEFSVIGSKPQPYATGGNEAITVTVNGPGDTPAPPAETTATVTANPLPPSVTLVSPQVGPITGGTQVTITGSNLANATVLFGSTQAVILSDNGTSIVALSPQSVAGPANIIVTTPSGTVSAADQFTYIGTASPSQSSATVASATIPTSVPITVTLTARDANGTQELTGGLAVAFGLGAGSGTGTFGPVTDNSNGTYSATFTGTSSGRDTITATINGQAVTAQAPVVTVTSSAAAPTVTVSDPGGAFNGQLFSATATVAGNNGQAGNSLEGVDPTLTYYAGPTASGTPLPAAPMLPGTYTVVASFPGSPHYTSASASTTFTISPGAAAATKLAVTLPSGAVAGSVCSGVVQVTDAYGNAVTKAGVVVNVTVSSGTHTSGPYVAVTNPQGQAVVSFLMPTLVGSCTVQASATGLGSSSGLLTITPAAAVKYQVSPPAEETAGSAFSVTVTALDAYSNLATGYNGSVALYSSDGQQVLGPAINLTNGVGQGQVTLDKKDTVNLVAVGGGISGFSGLTTVAAAAASTIQIYPSQSVVTAGSPFAVTIIAKDAYGNLANGLATLTASDGQAGMPPAVSLVNGVGTALVTLDKAETLSLQASMNGATQSCQLTVAPAGLASFSISAPSKATAGMGFTVSLTALDAFGNTVTSFTGPAGLLSSDNQPALTNVVSQSNAVSMFNGVGQATVTLNKADTTALLVECGNAIMGASGSIVVSSNPPSASAGPAITFQVSPPAKETAGSAFNVTVTAKDANGNTVSGYNGSVTLYGEGLQLGTVNLKNGVGTASVTLTVATTTQLVAVGGGLEGVSGLTTVQPAAPSTVQVIVAGGYPVVTAGSAFAVTVIAKDTYGNGCTGLVSLTTSDGQGGALTSVNVVNGVGTAYVTLDKADTLSIQAKLNGVVQASNSFTVLPAGLASFVVSAPSSVTAGTAFAVTVTAMDAFGNVLTGFTGQVSLQSSDYQTLLVTQNSQITTPNVMLTKGVGTALVTLNGADPLGLTVDSGLGESNTIVISAGL